MSCRPPRARSAAASWLAAIEASPWSLAVLLPFAVLAHRLAELNLSLEMPLAHQLKKLNPDAKLYWALAQNLVNGRGHVDTLRNYEILPSIGHPFVLASASWLFGARPTTISLCCLSLSSALVAWAVFRYSRRLSLTLVALTLYAVLLGSVRWLAGNVEPTLQVVNALLLATLAELYRSSRWRRWGVLAGLALAAQLLVRPVLLFPVHAAAAAALVALAVPAVRGWLSRGPRPFAAYGVALALLVSELVLGTVNVYSRIQYGDPRLVTGTYGSWTLYCANSPDIPTNKPFRDRFKYSPRWVELSKLISPRYGTVEKVGWEQRHRIMLTEVRAYWTSQPLRALDGWRWRMQRLLGLHATMFSGWRSVAHGGAVAVLAALAVLAAMTGRGRSGLGCLAALLALMYAGIHALFVWVGMRYATPLFPFLAVGIGCAAADLGRRR